MQLSTPTPVSRRAAGKRPPTIPYPELPGSTPEVLFWRAAWIRDLAQVQALEQLAAQKSFQRMSPPLRSSIFVCIGHMQEEAKHSFEYLVALGGLLYAWLPEGGAA